jgi:signal transduction histidine kinase
VSYEPGFVTVSITDSQQAAGPGPAANGGVAASPAAATPASLLASGFGLAGIAERVASCGGNLSVGPTSSGGFAVTARLPAQ